VAEQKNRMTHSTEVNDVSSRSHAVYQLAFWRCWIVPEPKGGTIVCTTARNDSPKASKSMPVYTLWKNAFAFVRRIWKQRKSTFTSRIAPATWREFYARAWNARMHCCISSPLSHPMRPIRNTQYTR
jgi:hypothetical protein